MLGSEAGEREIKELIERHGEVFIKPVFKGGIGKKGKSGLLRPEQSSDNTFSAEKARIYAAGGYVENGRVNSWWQL